MESFARISLFLLVSLVAAGAMPHGKFGMPASCAGRDYCTEKHELYPQALVDRLMRSTNISFTSSQATPPTVVHREGEERDCEASSTVDPIYEIIDADGDVRVVLQTEQDFRQTVTIERCLRPGHIDYETAHFKLETVKKFNLHCVEEKLKVGFMVLTQDWEGVEMVKPKTGIPVGCDCKLYGKL